MNSLPFLEPKLTGARFTGGEIPLEVLADFAVLTEMIVEIAKWKYRNQNPNRKRVPRGFADGISLKLTEVRDGSAIPVIILSFATGTLYPTEHNLFEQSKSAIVDAIGAAENNKIITQYLPPKLLGYFDRFGRNLAEGEAIELTDSPTRAPVKLTKETRKKLILASSDDFFSEETTIYGLVHEFDQRNKTFQLMSINGTIVTKIPIQIQHYDSILEALNGFRDKLRISVFGIGRFDRSNRLVEIEKIEHVTILDPLDTRLRIEEIKLLKPGWLNGRGLAPDHEGLNWLADSLDAHYPADITLPYLFPTPEGGVLAEWSFKPWAMSLTIDLKHQTGQWHGLNLETDAEQERELNLSDTEEWQWLGQQIRQYIPEIV